MSWYDKGLHVDPSLVALTGGTGRGVAAFGDSLVALGGQKVKRAKEDALKKELKATKAAELSANNVKNRVLNPTATKAMAASYGIDENSPLFKKGAPSQFNADLGLVNLGKETKASKTLKFTKPDKSGQLINYYTDGTSEPTGRYAPKPSYKSEAYRTKVVMINGKNYIAQYNPRTKRYESTGQLSGKQPPKYGATNSKSAKPNIVSVETLTPAQRYYAQVHNLKFVKNGTVMVDATKIPKTFTAKKDTKFGNEKVE